jgi:chromosome partitioning protein
MGDLSSGGLTLKFMSMLANVNHSSISRFVTDTSKEFKGSQKRNFRYSYEETRRILTKYVAERNSIDTNKKIHAFYNFKGGTGKTSLCYQVAIHLALCGYKILLIDADPQSHLTMTLGITNNYDLPTLYDGIVNNMSLDNIAISLIDGIDLIPCNLSLTNIEVRLNEMLKKEEVLKRYIDPIKDRYDFIIFDCNPSISNLNRNILNVSNVLDVVCETHPYSMLGMKVLFEDLDRFYTVMGMIKPEIIIIPNKYEDRSNLSGEAIAVLHKYYSEYVEPSFAVRKSEEFPKSARDRLPTSYFCK